MTYQQDIVALMHLQTHLKILDKEAKQCGAKLLFTQEELEVLDASIDAFKTLDDMGNTMKKLLTERSNSYETLL